jgi:hypothetical protein
MTRKEPFHIALVKMQRLQNKEGIQEKGCKIQMPTYKGKPNRITPNLSEETLEARKAWMIY